MTTKEHEMHEGSNESNHGKFNHKKRKERKNAVASGTG